MSDQQSRVYAWIERQAEQAGLRELVLSHLNAADQLQRVAVFRFDGGNLGELKSELFRTALDVVASWRHFQRFAVQSYFGESLEPAAYFPFALNDDSAAAQPEATEPGNLVGVLKQQMRHNEILMKVSARLQLDANTMLVQQLRYVSDELGNVRRDYAALLRESEAVLLNRRTQEATQALALAAEARKDKMADSVAHALPALANRVSEKLTGKPLLPEGGPRDLLIARLRQVLTDGGVEKLLDALPSDAERQIVLELLTGSKHETH